MDLIYRTLSYTALGAAMSLCLFSEIEANADSTADSSQTNEPIELIADHHGDSKGGNYYQSPDYYYNSQNYYYNRNFDSSSSSYSNPSPSFSSSYSDRSNRQERLSPEPRYSNKDRGYYYYSNPYYYGKGYKYYATPYYNDYGSPNTESSFYYDPNYYYFGVDPESSTPETPK